MPSSPQFLLLLVLATCALGDPIDWLNIEYVCNQAQRSSSQSSTKDAQNAIMQSARSSTSGGPWSIAQGQKNSKNPLPPSGDLHDYLSWAPYHWPDCNWCVRRGKRVDLLPSVNGSLSGNHDDETVHQTIPERGMSRRRRRSAVIPEPENFANVQGQQAPVSAPSPTTIVEAASANETPHEDAAAEPKPASCTPSPTKPMPPSATWTTCPYVVRDGQVNPDVRTLNGVSAIQSASQAISLNTYAFALNPVSGYSQNAVRFIDAFFLAATTKMNPNMNFGQVVRGPDTSQQGTFTGVLDLRGIVRIINAAVILIKTGSADWTSARDQAMRSWGNSYLDWLKNSDLGRSVRAKANNHASFYWCQIAALSVLVGDINGATDALKTYFQGPFREQIAATGEQPFEAVRTRPFHYRCFNLEAMITLAKLGDQLGMDFWTARSRYQGTIQNAVDFVMKQDPKQEDPTELAPHVAAVAAAYGDPTGKYTAFLQGTDSEFKSRPFWFYNQPAAFTKAPGTQTASKKSHTRDTDATDNIPQFKCLSDFVVPGTSEKGYELYPGLYVTCGELEPLYALETDGAAGSTE